MKKRDVSYGRILISKAGLFVYTFLWPNNIPLYEYVLFWVFSLPHCTIRGDILIPSQFCIQRYDKHFYDNDMTNIWGSGVFDAIDL